MEDTDTDYCNNHRLCSIQHGKGAGSPKRMGGKDPEYRGHLPGV